jgi:hypothetical protein
LFKTYINECYAEDLSKLLNKLLCILNGLTVLFGLKEGEERAGPFQRSKGKRFEAVEN